MFSDPPSRMKWPRSQRFVLSHTGIAAEAAYLAAVVASRTQAGRASFDAARTSWAESFHIQPDDGIYLGEIRAGSNLLEEIVENLETCGKTRKDAMVAIERLIAQELISTMEAPPSSRRY